MDLTVIMSVYNSENEQLKKSIESILNQTYKNYIFLIIDDGTSKENKELIQEYKKKDKRIRIIENKNNLGLVNSLNKAIKVISTKYIARMDADDVSQKDRLEKQIIFMEQNEKFAFCGTRANYINENGIYNTSKIYGEIYLKTLIRFCVFFHSSLMIRTKILQDNGMYDDYKRNEDYALYLKLYSNGFKGYILEDILLDYRQDKESFQRKKYKDRLIEFKVRKKYFKLFKINSIKRVIYTIKPLIVGLIPKIILYNYKKLKNAR